MHQTAHPARSRWAVLATVVAMSFMSTLDGSIVNVALPTMERALGVGTSQVSWVSSIYLIVCCATVLVFGRAADRFGKARFFAGGVAAFTLGSALCGISSTLPVLIAARVVQALGASAAMATNMGIVTQVFPAGERGRALGIVSTFVSLGLMCGPVLGGVLVARFPWEAIFLINVPVGVLTLAACARTLPRDAGAPQQAGAPLIKLDLIARPAFALNLFAMLACFVAVGATELILPFYLQDACGYDAGVAGVLLTAIPVVMAVVGPVAGAVSDRIGGALPCVVGMLIYAVGIALTGLLPADAGPVRIYLTVSIMSLGTGMFQSPNNALIMGSVDASDLGFAGGLASLVRYLGMALGVMGGTTLLYGYLGARAGRPIASAAQAGVPLFLEGFAFSFMVLAAIVLAGGVAAALAARARRGTRDAAA